jgi:5-dehydro-2-deoxygluconokinase
VLGRGDKVSAVHRWLATAAQVPGFTGFAVGRTVWWEPLRAFMAGGSREVAVESIAHNYLDLVDTYGAAQRREGEEVR